MAKKQTKETKAAISHAIQKKFLKLQEEMTTVLKERDDEVECLIGAMLSKQHMLMIAQKGTAKTLAAELIASALGVDFFLWLMMKTTTPDEIFGPVMLSKLKLDIYERNIKGKLPTASIALLDEIFKSNSSILNGLMRILNERKYNNNGGDIDVPLITLIGASNEFPEGDELAAMYDRFMYRLVPKYIAEDGNFCDMLAARSTAVTTRISADELTTAQAEVRKTEIPDTIFETVAEIRRNLKSEGIQPSDRRYKQALTCVQAHAWLAGRDTVISDDLDILRHILWDEVEHIPKVSEAIISLTHPHMMEVQTSFDAILSKWKSLQEAEDAERAGMASEAYDTIRKEVEHLEALRVKIKDEKRSTGEIDKIIAKSKDILTNKIAKGIFKIDADL